MPSLYSRRPLAAACLWLGAMATPAGVAADPAPPLPDLLAQSQSTAPRLAEARAGVARAQGLARQARTWPNPTLGLEVENVAGSGPYRGSGLSETTLSLAQTLELGGKRSARAAAGRADVDAASARERQARADYAFDLTLAYAEAEAAERRLALARETLSLAEADARIATALVREGREADLRRLQAQGAVQSARAGVDEAQAARATTLANLTALAGAPVPFTSVPASLLDVGVGSAPGTELMANAALAAVAAAAERDAAARRLEAERRRSIPDVTLSIGMRRFAQDDSSALVAGVSVPLPLFDRNRGAADAARADVAAAEARLAAARFQAEAAVRSGAARIVASESRLEASQAADRTALEAYRLARIGYEAGRVSLAELTATRRSLAEAREQGIAASVERVSAQAGIVRLGGGIGPAR